MRGEPAAVRQIPPPHSFSRLPFAETEYWFACGPRPRARQGWKLYVPLTLLNAPDLVERLVPLLQTSRLHFKYIKNIELLRKLNAGMFGYTQIGKCFVIYVPSPDRSLITRLKNLLKPYRDQCPTVPCAVPFGDSLPLYYRYGSYVGPSITLGKDNLNDDREKAENAVPAGIKDLLVPYTVPVSENPAIRSFMLRYPAFEAIFQQGKCGVFRALNIESDVFEEVVLKVGYHRGQLQPDGADGCTLLRRELAFYEELKLRGLAGLAPQLLDALDIPRKVILTLEYIPGPSLLTRKLISTLTTRHLDRCWSIINKLHASGIYLGDAKLANFIATDTGVVRVVDFEAAGVIGEEPPDVRTFFIEPLPKDPRAADRLHFLASVLFPYEAGRYSWSDRHVDLIALTKETPDTDHARWAHRKLRLEMKNLC